MGTIFRSGLYACDVGGSLIFLDLIADRYFAIDGAARDTCLRLVQGLPQVSDDTPILAALHQSGLLQTVEGAGMPQMGVRVPKLATSARDRPRRSPSPRLVVPALTRYAIAMAELKLRPLHAVLGRIAHSKQRRRSLHPKCADPSAFAEAFAQIDQIVTAVNRCLPRSIALAGIMIANGLHPDLVIGVKLRPFEAHCWVQIDDILVSDDLGTIAPFTPILLL